MTIYVDGDACSVKDLIVECGLKYHLRIIIVISICHIANRREDAEYIIVDHANQSVDMTIINKAIKNDIVVTDDYGLASILLSKKVFCLSTKGFVYTLENIDELLLRRHIHQKILRGGGKIKGPSKRSKQHDQHFIDSFEKLIFKSLI